MTLKFEYDRNKDIWCLLNKGKSSNNSPNPTRVYELLTKQYRENPTEIETGLFIDEYFHKHTLSTEHCIEQYQSDWLRVNDEYHKRAKNIFGIDLPQDITAYLTINNRNPYSIKNNMFYVSIPRDTVRKTIMHELWHFYTWYGLGAEQEKVLGASKYNELKEAFTILLNVECSDLFPQGIQDDGYPQHQELRNQIKEMWLDKKDIEQLWQYFSLHT